MLLIGLTGSIGMGKSTTADVFRSEGVPVYDSDAAVHEIYRGPAAREIENAFPGTLVDGRIDRTKLASYVLDDRVALKRLESIVHPLVWQARAKFLNEQKSVGAEIVVLDIPLLFETGADKQVDVIVVASAPPDIQKERVLSRPNMSEEKFAAILIRQTPDEEKRRRADFIVHTDKGVGSAREQVRAILKALASSEKSANQHK